MKARASITYETTTPESAEHGDFAEHGWYMPGGWEYPLQDNDGHHEDVLDQARAGDFDMTIRDAIEAAKWMGGWIDCGSWFSTCSPDEDYQTGEDTYYSLHPEGVTPSTYRRIARLLGA